MPRIKLATAGQVADVVRITAVPGQVLSGGTPTELVLSNTRFCHIDPIDPTQVVLDRGGLYAQVPVSGPDNKFATDLTDVPTIYAADRPCPTSGGGGTTDGSNIEGVLVYLIVPMDSVSPEPDVEE